MVQNSLRKGKQRRPQKLHKNVPKTLYVLLEKVTINSEAYTNVRESITAEAKIESVFHFSFAWIHLHVSAK